MDDIPYEPMTNDELEAALADTNRRFAAAERREARYIEAIADEFRALSDRVAALEAGTSKDIAE